MTVFVWPKFGPNGRLAGVLTLLLAAVSAQAATGKQFTVVEEVGLAHFGDPYGGEAEAVQFSPDGYYFAALTERGRIDLNRPEDTLRIYRVQDVLSTLRRGEAPEPPAPLWTIDRSTDKDGPIITHWRWLKDSSGIAFLERGAHGTSGLMLADLKAKTIESLTPKGEAIKAFDIRDREHYVYAVPDPDLLQRAAAEDQAAAIVGTGRSLLDLLFPVDENPETATTWFDRCELWAVVGGRSFQVKEAATGHAVLLFTEGQHSLALSPDGETLVTALPVPEVPPDWETVYPPPFAAYPSRLHAGKQDLTTFMGVRLVSHYVHIDLRNGTIQSLLEGPISSAAGWQVLAGPAWSEDGMIVALPGAFVVSGTQTAARPCIAVVSQTVPTVSCVERIQGPNASGEYPEGFHWIKDVRFEARDRVVVSYDVRGIQGATEYRRMAGGTWIAGRQTSGAGQVASKSLQLAVKQSLNEPPVLVAMDARTKVSRFIWDPNPHLKDLWLGEATTYKWRDKTGRDWKGGLYKPAHYETGHPYPLVIQTHGFTETQFRPSGLFPTAFAARALAGAGIVVLQVENCQTVGTPAEGPCNVAGYEAAVSDLVKEGLVDSERVGIIGFSRSCFYVMEALTTSALHIKAASITDGVMGDYLQYMNYVDVTGFADDAAAMIDARPFGEGLQQWLQRSPLFNMDKMSAALLVVAEGRRDLPFMWGPYAALRYLHKPVELVVLNTDEHVLTNPAARLASQGGSVDWFRFWLQDYEDPDPAKAEQYKRWRELRKMQIAQDADRAKAADESTNVH